MSNLSVELILLEKKFGCIKGPIFEISDTTGGVGFVGIRQLKANLYLLEKINLFSFKNQIFERLDLNIHCDTQCMFKFWLKCKVFCDKNADKHI